MTYDTNTTADQLVAEFGSIIKNKVILTTGITPGGLGAAFVESIAKGQPGLIILAGRNLEKLQKEVDTITAAQPNVKIRGLKLDPGSFAAIREAAGTVNSWADVPHATLLSTMPVLWVHPTSLQLTASKASMYHPI